MSASRTNPPLTPAGGQFTSRAIHSNQTGVHPRLKYTVLKHRNTQYKKPFQAHNLQAFDTLRQAFEHSPYSQIILDSCCGTGLSTQQLALKHPNHWVVGLDRSKVRLSKQHIEQLPSNCTYVQSNCEDIWRLCLEAKLPITHHYILYPNPYPKAEHLMRRWHGHPAFGLLPNLAGHTHLRSNWSLYLEEFALAWSLITGLSTPVTTLNVSTPLTLFERKYHLSGQALFQWSAG